MVNRMEELEQLHVDNVAKLNISEDKTTHQYRNRSEVAIPRGQLVEEIYDNFYDIDNTITTSQATNPHDEDNVNYNQEQIFVALERNSPYIWVCNDATTNDAAHVLFVIASHKGGQHFSRERPIYAQQFKVYKNAYEIRLRSPTQGLAYRVTEYEIGTI